MRILIENSVPFLSDNKNEISSTNVYLFNIITNFSERYEDIEILVVTNGLEYLEKLSGCKNVKVIYSKVRNPLIWLNIVIPFISIKYKVDIVFFGKSASCFFRIPGKKIITTIHGLIYKVLPETSSVIENIYWRLMAKIAYIVSHKIIVVSDSDKKDLIEDGCKVDKIQRIPIGLDKKYFTFKPNIEFLREYGIQEKQYILQIGGISHKKNQKFTIDIFIKNIAHKYPKIKLVFVGPILDIEYFNDIEEEIKLSGFSDRIIFTKGINQNMESEKFISLVSFSKILLFPSLYEGFGIPPLEAISQKVPAIISDKGSLPEVYGPENVLELDSKNWGNVINKLLSDENFYSKYISDQNKILPTYKWENIITEYKSIFKI